MWQTKGHDQAIGFIKRSIETNRISHAYLISGDSYIGKTTLAFDIAKAINCFGPGEDYSPCEKCTSCTRIINNTHVDIHVLDFSKPKISPIEQLRKDFLGEIYKNPYEGSYKIFIISHIDKMRSEHANLLLKTLEEPPSDAVIILISENKMKILDTILSRCQILDLYPTTDIFLLENTIKTTAVPLSDDLDVELLVKLSRGRIGWIRRVLFDPDLFFSMQNLLDDLETAVYGSFEERFKFSSKLANNINVVEGFSDIYIMMTWWRDIMMIILNNETEILNTNRIDVLRDMTNNFNIDQVLEIIKALDLAKTHLNMNANPLLVYDNLFIDIPIIYVSN